MICPKCGKEYDRLLAQSRYDKNVCICDLCGSKEAIEIAIKAGAMTISEGEEAIKQIEKAYDDMKMYKNK